MLVLLFSCLNCSNLLSCCSLSLSLTGSEGLLPALACGHLAEAVCPSDGGGELVWGPLRFRLLWKDLFLLRNVEVGGGEEKQMGINYGIES